MRQQRFDFSITVKDESGRDFEVNWAALYPNLCALIEFRRVGEPTWTQSLIAVRADMRHAQALRLHANQGHRETWQVLFQAARTDGAVEVAAFDDAGTYAPRLVARPMQYFVEYRVLGQTHRAGPFADRAIAISRLREIAEFRGVEDYRVVEEGEKDSSPP